ncbi:proton-coupled zinc antiporter SLC30A2-like [Tubulanus polymorphus]|uniref:proton-coupled zinc antiporter SLC30A2-like n=1 Tax=Tubulanus polymorphus TaxID=672921 RepID=UPI003DA1FB86
MSERRRGDEDDNARCADSDGVGGGGGGRSAAAAAAAAGEPVVYLPPPPTSRPRKNNQMQKLNSSENELLRDQEFEIGLGSPRLVIGGPAAAAGEGEGRGASDREQEYCHNADDVLLLRNHTTIQQHQRRPLLAGSGDDDDSLLLEDDKDEDEDSDDDYIEVDHCHPHPRWTGSEAERRSDKLARNQLIAVSVLCLAFMIGEIIGGVYANSLALITDATHLASDLCSFIISLFALFIANKTASVKHTFGFRRAEVLGALVSVLIIWIVTGILVYLAVLRFINRDYEINADDMLITSGCGVAFNIIMGVVLHSELCACHHPTSFGHVHSHGGATGHSHGGATGHSHGGATGHSHGGAPSQKNINVRAAFIHVIGDLIQSIGVLIAAYIIKFVPGAKIADPICTFLFSILVLITTLTVLRDVITVIMEGVPKSISVKKVKTSLEKISGVKMAHSLHVWSLSIDQFAVAVHVAVVSGCDYDQILNQATGILQQKYKFQFCTVQVECYNPDVMLNCDKCIHSINM